MAQRIQLGEIETRGELALLKHLERELPSEWMVVGNPTVTFGRHRSQELDVLVIGPRGVWVLEDKGFRGMIQGDHQVWMLEGGKEERALLDKVERSAKKLKGFLLAKCQDVAEKVYVKGLVTLPDSAEILVVDPRVPDMVCRLAEVAERLLCDRPGVKNPLASSQIELLTRAVTGDYVFNAAFGLGHTPGASEEFQGSVQAVLPSGALLLTTDSNEFVVIPREHGDRSPSLGEVVRFRPLGAAGTHATIMGALMGRDHKTSVVGIRGTPVVFITSSGPAPSFRRVYYSDTCLDETQLRGAGSLQVLRTLGVQIRLAFAERRVALTLEAATQPVHLDGRPVTLGMPVRLPLRSVPLNVGSIELRVSTGIA